MDDSSANLNAIISVLGGEFMSGRKSPELGVVGHLHDFRVLHHGLHVAHK